jgi:hypothetical protein
VRIFDAGALSGIQTPSNIGSAGATHRRAAHALDIATEHSRCCRARRVTRRTRRSGSSGPCEKQPPRTKHRKRSTPPRPFRGCDKHRHVHRIAQR